jgi:hypothetical protein
VPEIAGTGEAEGGETFEPWNLRPGWTTQTLSLKKKKIVYVYSESDSDHFSWLMCDGGRDGK